MPGVEQKLEEVLQKWKENEEKQKELVRKKAVFYQEWKEGKIDREEFFYRKTCCEQEISRWEKEKEEWGSMGQNNGIVTSEQNSNLPFFFKSGEIEKGKTVGEKVEKDEHLPIAWVNELIERVEVFEKNRVKVCFSFAAMEEQ